MCTTHIFTVARMFSLIFNHLCSVVISRHFNLTNEHMLRYWRCFSLLFNLLPYRSLNYCSVLL